MSIYTEQKKIFKRACCNKCVEDEKSIWFPWYTANGICRIDKKTNRAEIVSEFDIYDETQKQLYGSIEKVEDLLICIPSSADKICVYDIMSNELQYIQLEDRKGNQKIYGKKFSISFQDKDNIYMLPINYPAIVKMNMTNFKVSYIDKWYLDLKKEIPFDNFRGYFGDCIVIDNEVWIVCASIPMIVKMSLRWEYFEYYHLNTIMEGFWGVLYDGQYFWITGRGQNANYVFRWNPVTEEGYDILINDLDETIWDPFHSPIDAENKILLFPISAQHVYSIDKKTLSSKICDSLDRCIKKKSYSLGQHQIMNLCIKEDKVHFISGADFMWYLYNVQTDELTAHEYTISNIPFNIFYNYIFENIRVESDKDSMEAGRLTLKTFIQIISEIEDEKITGYNK